MPVTFLPKDFNVGKLYGAGAYFDEVSLNADIKGSGLVAPENKFRY